jgi:DNA-binding XRE family transcriptional regulator
MKENNIPNLLINLRKEKGFTQSDLADKLDISFQAVSKWERGENLPDAYTLLALAKIYGITVDEILNGKLIERKKKSRLSRRLINIIMTIGVALLMISPIPYLIRTSDDLSSGNIIASLITVVLGVSLLVFAGLEMDRGSRRTLKSKDEIRIDNIVYSICVVIFLGAGLIWQLFHVAWIVFILGYAVTLIFKK